MRSLALVVAVLGVTATARAQPAFVQANCIAATNGTVWALDASVPAGDLVVVCLAFVSVPDAGVATITDGLGTPLTLLHPALDTGSYTLAAYYGFSSGGPWEVRFALQPAGLNVAEIYLHHYTGVNTKGTVVTARSTGTSPSSAVVQAEAGTLAFSCVTYQDTVTSVAPPWIPRNRCSNDMSADYITTDAGPVSVRYFGAANVTWGVSVALFEWDAGVDAGEGDAGEADAGGGDAGSTDAGEEDAGRPDAGGGDAGAVDAGLEDAGVADAGFVDAGSDGGSPHYAVGCGCQSGPAAWFPFGVALWALAQRKRRVSPHPDPLPLRGRGSS